MQGEGVAVINRWAGKLTKSWCVSNIISVCATTPQEVEECTVDLDQVKNIELSISRTSAGEGKRATGGSIRADFARSLLPIKAISNNKPRTRRGLFI